MFASSAFSEVPFSSASGGKFVFVTGVAATGQIGLVEVYENEVILVSGVVGTTALGEEIVGIGVIQPVSGVDSTSQLGDVTVELNANVVFPLGVSCTATLNFVASVWIDVDDYELEDWVEIIT